MTSDRRCPLCGHFHARATSPCVWTDQWFLLRTSFRVTPDAEDRLADADLARFLQATHP